MVGYEAILQDTYFYIDKLISDVKSMAINEDNESVLPLGTTAWGNIKAIINHLDDMEASILGTERYNALEEALAIAEARD